MSKELYESYPGENAFNERFGGAGPRYNCERGTCRGHQTLESDRVTHDQYHDDIEAGMPSRFAGDFDYLLDGGRWIEKDYCNLEDK